MVEMATPSRRIYNRTASAHINVSSPISPPPPSPSSIGLSQQTARKSTSPSPATLAAPSAPPAAKKKKKKRAKGKGGGAGTNHDTPLGDEELDYSRRDGYDDDRDLTDDDIPDLPDLVDIDRPTSLMISMTATSSTSSKTPTTTSAGSKSKKKKKKNKGGSNIISVDGFSNGDSSLGSREDGIKQKKKIWNTTTAEEKERIKEFWIGLTEQERKDLVRIEKEHVHKRIKEGSKILNCSCHVCGRKQYRSPSVIAVNM